MGWGMKNENYRIPPPPSQLRKLGVIFTHENSLNVLIFCSCIKCIYLNRKKGILNKIIAYPKKTSGELAILIAYSAIIFTNLIIFA